MQFLPGLTLLMMSLFFDEQSALCCLSPSSLPLPLPSLPLLLSSSLPLQSSSEHSNTTWSTTETLRTSQNDVPLAAMACRMGWVEHTVTHSIAGPSKGSLSNRVCCNGRQHRGRGSGDNVNTLSTIEEISH